MRRRKAEKCAAVLLAAVIAVMGITICLNGHTEAAAMKNGSTELYAERTGAECGAYSGTNVEAQNYTLWAKPINSYLEYENEKWMRFQADAIEDGQMEYLVEYYDLAYNLQKTVQVPRELPVFGGFYATDSNYYIVSGQNNKEESDAVEVYRITKYDKFWNRIGSAGLYGANTTIPFRAGSCRMTHSGKYLLIRTCHEMYASKKDGRNHQANVTIQVDTGNMTVTDAYTQVMNSAYGYISHSFNQFIKVENNKIAALDHGDAFPRSMAVTLYATDMSDGTFAPDYNSRCTVLNLLSFPGAVGNNTTGASAGGFEVSGTHYLAVGNSINQAAFDTSKTRNIFLSAVAKDTHAVSTKWFTGYAEGEEGANTPHLVKITNDRFFLLWSRKGQVYYVQVNGSGNQVGEIYSMEGNLSDCVPKVVNKKLVWYTWKNDSSIFYEIDLDSPANHSRKQVEIGHTYVNQGVVNGYATLVCKKCGHTERMRVPKSIVCMWPVSEMAATSSEPKVIEVGKRASFYCIVSPEEANDEVIVRISNPDVLKLSEEGKYFYLEGKKNGNARLTVTSKYNPAASVSFLFRIGDGASGDADGDGNITSDDAMAILMYVAGKELSGNFIAEAADCDGTVGITSDDALAVLMHVAGKESLS